MSEPNQPGKLIKIEPLAPAVRTGGAGDVAAMMQTVIDRGVTAENVAALEKLVGLYERMQDRDADKQYASAFVELKKELPEIQAMEPVPDKYGGVKYKYAPLDQIEAVLKPFALKHGFCWSFKEGPQVQQKITEICVVFHTAGGTKEHPYTVRIGSGPPGATESQADGSAHSYAKRGALCSAFGITISHEDNDANVVGEPITPEQIKSLQERVAALRMEPAKFLKYAGAKVWEEIGSSDWDRLDEFLTREAKSAPGAPRNPQPTSDLELLVKSLKQQIWDLTKDKHQGSRKNLDQWLIDECILSDTETVAKMPVSRLTEVVVKIKQKMGFPTTTAGEFFFDESKKRP